MQLTRRSYIGTLVVSAIAASQWTATSLRDQLTHERMILAQEVHPAKKNKESAKTQERKQRSPEQSKQVPRDPKDQPKKIDSHSKHRWQH